MHIKPAERSSSLIVLKPVRIFLNVTNLTALELSNPVKHSTLPAFHSIKASRLPAFSTT